MKEILEDGTCETLILRTPPKHVGKIRLLYRPADQSNHTRCGAEHHRESQTPFRRRDHDGADTMTNPRGDRSRLFVVVVVER